MTAASIRCSGWPDRPCGSSQTRGPTQWCWPVTSWPHPASPWSTEPAPSVEPFALLDSLPGAVLDTAREWERHVVEIETGLPPGAEPGLAPKPEYDPSSATVVDRDRAKAAELGVGVRTVQTRRARYAQQGLWGLVDQRAVRAWEATGRADARLVAAAREVIDAETDTSTGTRSRLIRRVTKAVEATYGPGVVP